MAPAALPTPPVPADAHPPSRSRPPPISLPPPPSSYPTYHQGTTSKPSTPSTPPTPSTAGRTTKSNWDAIRRRVLAPPTASPRTLGSRDGRASPSIRDEKGDSRPSSPAPSSGGFARLVGAGMAKRRAAGVGASTVVDGSSEIKFRLEEELGRLEGTLGSGRGISGGTSRGGGESGRSGMDGRSMYVLLGLLERCRVEGMSLPCQTRVLAVLSRYFRAGMDEDGLRVMEKVLECMARGMQEVVEKWNWMLEAARVETDERRLATIIKIFERSVASPSSRELSTMPASPLTLQSLLASLLRTILYLSYRSQSTYVDSLRGLIHNLATGQLMVLSNNGFAQALSLPLETFDSLSAPEMSRIVTFHSLLVIALAGGVELRKWMVGRGSDVLEQYWVEGPPAFTEHVSSLVARLSHTMLSSDDRDVSSLTNSLFDLISPRYPSTTLSSLQPTHRTHIAYTYLAFLSLSSPPSPVSTLASKWIEAAYRLDKKSVLDAVKRAILQVPQAYLMRIVECTMLRASQRVGDGIAGGCLMPFFQRIIKDTLLVEDDTLRTLLLALATRHPQSFYKPLFTLASSTALTLPASLIMIHRLTAIIGPTYLLRDAEMMVVLLLSDLSESDGTGWAGVKDGQLVLIVEMISALRRVEGEEDREVVRSFGESFESRIAMFLEAREQTSALPLSQRSLICAILFELRMFNKPAHRLLWLARVVAWTTSGKIGDIATLVPKKGSLSPPTTVTVSHATIEEGTRSLERLQSIYVEAGKRAPLLSSTKDSLSTLSFDPLSSNLILLVAVSRNLAHDHLQAVCRVVWESLDDETSKRFRPASYLLMLCGEIVPAVLDGILTADLTSPSSTMRHRLITRLSSVFTARFDIVTQPSADPSQRRILHVSRAQVAFVPISIGSPDYVASEGRDEPKLELGSTLPPEVRRALVELGWEGTSSTSSETERQMRPLSLLPNDSMDSTGGTAMRRRSSGMGTQAVVTEFIAKALMGITDLVGDPSAVVATIAKDALFGFLRDDPNLILSPVVIDLAGTIEDQTSAIRRIRQLLSIQSTFPCGASHFLFNHLGGYLKNLAKEPPSTQGLDSLALVLPSAAALVLPLSDFSLASVKKNKVETLLLPTGTFWFSESTTRSFFPRYNPPTDLTPFRRTTVDSTTFRVGMVRIAQNLAMASHVREHPREAHAMKKLFVDPFDLPTLSHLPPILDRKYFVVRSTLPTTKSRKEQDERNLCSLVARSWLLLILEILSGLSRSFNLRPELASLLDSVNRILIVHGDDTNLVGLALRIYMLASSRFRRLFAANGFELVVPVIFRVFVEARGNEGIRSACRYAWQRFYRAHEESFVVQALSIISPMLGVEVEEGRSAMVEGSWELFEALRMDKRDGEDVAGIRGENEREERESLIYRANNAPDLFLQNFTPSTPSTRLSTLDSTKSFSTENLVKLFVTIIAFDPTSLRSLDFLHLLGEWVPSFNRAGDTTRAVLKDAVEALAVVYGKGNNGKMRKGARARDIVVEGTPPLANEADDSSPDSPSRFSRFISYLIVVGAFLRSGGQLSSTTTRSILDIVQVILTDPIPSAVAAASTCIATLTTSVIGTNAAPTRAQVASFLNDISAFVKSNISLVDFSILFDILSNLPTAFKQDKMIAQVAVRNLIIPAIDTFSTPSFPSSTAAIGTVARWLDNSREDFVKEIERQDVTPVFIAHFVLPLFLRIHHDDHPVPSMTSLLRLLHHVLSSTHNDAQDDDRTLAIHRTLISQLLKLLLSSPRFSSLLSSPDTILRISSHLHQSLDRRSSDFLSGQSRVGIDDYNLWSTLEFLYRVPNPLRMYFKGLVADKVRRVGAVGGGGGGSKFIRQFNDVQVVRPSIFASLSPPPSIVSSTSSYIPLSPPLQFDSSSIMIRSHDLVRRTHARVEFVRSSFYGQRGGEDSVGWSSSESVSPVSSETHSLLLEFNL